VITMPVLPRRRHADHEPLIIRQGLRKCHWPGYPSLSSSVRDPWSTDTTLPVAGDASPAGHASDEDHRLPPCRASKVRGVGYPALPDIILHETVLRGG
jgi:hypothetical protein